MKRLLFVCSGNTCRSPMAQALLSKIIAEKMPQEEIEIESAGVYAQENLSATREAIEVMKEEGIDLSSHQSREISAEHISQADLVLTMTSSHRNQLHQQFPEFKERIFTIAEFAGQEQEIYDPYGLGEEAYRKTAEQLKEILYIVVDRLST